MTKASKYTRADRLLKRARGDYVLALAHATARGDDEARSVLERAKAIDDQQRAERALVSPRPFTPPNVRGD